MKKETRLTYDMSKTVYDSCLEASIKSAGIPVEKIIPHQLGFNITYRIRQWRDTGQLFIKFNEQFITEHRETDMRHVALFLYKETGNTETKLYLKMKWGF